MMTGNINNHLSVWLDATQDPLFQSTSDVTASLTFVHQKDPSKSKIGGALAAPSSSSDASC